MQLPENGGRRLPELPHEGGVQPFANCRFQLCNLQVQVEEHSRYSIRMSWQSQHSSNRGKGRSSSYRGRGGRGDSDRILRENEKKKFADSKNYEESSSSPINLEDIPKGHPLYEAVQKYISEQSVKGVTETYLKAAQDTDDIKSYERVSRKEKIFPIEYADIQWKKEPWKILQRYLVHNVYFPGFSYKTRTYYENILTHTGSAEITHFKGYSSKETIYSFSKLIIKHVISAEEWGLSTFTERQVLIDKVRSNFTYWDYIQAFSTVLYYNNEKQKHTWFLKICSNIFKERIPNWFITWWMYHGPTMKILPETFKLLYLDWTRVSPHMDEAFRIDLLAAPDRIGHIYFYTEFSIPWIHKWIPEFGYDEDNIPCLYRVYYNNFWDKMNKIDPQTGCVFGQSTIDHIKLKIEEYTQNKMDIPADTSVHYVANKINYSQEDKAELINKYVEEYRNNLMKNLDKMKKSDSNKESDEADSEEGDEADSAAYTDFDDAQRPEGDEDLENFVQRMKKMKEKAEGKKKI